MSATVVDSLFNQCLSFFVKNINLVDSFEGFPEYIGEKIFRKFALEYRLNSNSFNHDLKKFVDAYENLILERLNLSDNLLILNEYFESIAIVLQNVTELCVCECKLGDNHDIIHRIADFRCLKKLCLRNNHMNCVAIKLLTLRTRMFGVGCKEIEHLDLSGNLFTEEILPWLVAFPKLQYLNLTTSNITKKGIRTLASKYSLYQIFTSKQHETIVNKGWATTLFERWEMEQREAKRRRLRRLYFMNKGPIGLYGCPGVSPSELIPPPLLFQKLPLREELSPPRKKIKLPERSKTIYL